MTALNSALRFSLELLTLFALALWGWHIDASTAVRMVTAVAAPAIVATVWGTWVAPRSKRRLSDPARFVLEITIFGTAAFALAAAGRPTIAAVFTGAVAASFVSMAVSSQRE